MKALQRNHLLQLVWPV